MKILNGAELADFIKERQAHEVRTLKSQKVTPKLVIIRDSDNPVITKYVNLKIQYGQDIGITVEDIKVNTTAEITAAIQNANQDPNTHGIIIQLPLKDTTKTAEVVQAITPAKDVDGLSGAQPSATATAIAWLLAGYDITLENKKIAIVGKGRLVGAPLIKMWQDSHLDVTVFDSHSDITQLKNHDIIVTATGQPHLITAENIKPGAIIVDAGTASEDGHLVGDVDDALRQHQSLIGAITPKVGGVGPLTVTVLFENVIIAAKAKTAKATAAKNAKN